ncbi:MAG: SDR family oxidoreductase [Pseudomonadota bacterium]
MPSPTTSYPSLRGKVAFVTGGGVNNAAHDTRSMARDLGPYGIRINTVTPGWVMTERQLREHVDADSDAIIAVNQCMPGKVMPADLAAMVLFLAANDSRMCTVQEFVVDAGWT